MFPNRHKQQRYEARQKNERSAVPTPVPPTEGQLVDYIGKEAFQRLIDAGVLSGELDCECDSVSLREYYGSEGGLLHFLADGFPASTSLKPFGEKQQSAIGIVESVIRNSGTEQSLEPRAHAKSSRLARAALWAALFGFRRCSIIFQSNTDKAAESLQKIKNELQGSVFLRALFPGIATACRHASTNGANLLKNQHFCDEPTSIQWLKESIRLPDILGETGGGSRILVLPFTKAAGVSLSDPVTLEDVRPDLLLLDDVQSHDETGSLASNEKHMRLWSGSVRYLGGRGKAPAIIFAQTIFEVGDFADRIRQDASVHTVRYKALEEFPANMDWWEGPFKDALFSYDELDPNGLLKAREAARKLYIDNRDHADAGAVVAWEHAYDPETADSAIMALMVNYLTDKEAFYAQDQNAPEEVVPEGDIRCPASEIITKQHNEGIGIVPDFASKLVMHIDVQDHMLFWAICAGDNMRMALVANGSAPEQSQHYFTYRQAQNKLDNTEPYAKSPTVQDRIYKALFDLIDKVEASVFEKADGSVVKISHIGIDAADGDHMHTIHRFCKEYKRVGLIPMRGIAVKPSQTPMNQRPKGKTEVNRGDNWGKSTSVSTKVDFLTVNSSYYKAKLHDGLKNPIGTSESVSLFNAEPRQHQMLAEHCNNEKPAWTQSTNTNGETNGAFEWVKIPGRDEHHFDNMYNCLALLNYSGGSFAGVQMKQVKRSFKKWKGKGSRPMQVKRKAG